MTTGYSHKSLVQKLGLKDGQIVAFFSPPDGFFEQLEDLPHISYAGSRLQPCDFVLFFATDLTELSQQFSRLKHMINQTGMLWIAWPKGTDLKEDMIRQIGLENGLVDVKVITIDEQWSGLKFVYRVKDRT